MRGSNGRSRSPDPPLRSTAIRLFMQSVVKKGYFPIDMPKPNAQTLAAIADAKKRSGHAHELGRSSISVSTHPSAKAFLRASLLSSNDYNSV